MKIKALVKNIIIILTKPLTIFINAVIFLLCIFTCKNYKDSESINNWVGKSIAFSSIVTPAINDTTVYIESLLCKKYKLLVYIDGDCSLCFQDLTYWRNFKEKYIVFDNRVSFVFIIKSDNFYQLAYYLDEILFSYPVFYDREGLFFISNGLSYDKNYQTLILDINNKIVFNGSPVYNHKIEKKIIEYFQTI